MSNELQQPSTKLYLVLVYSVILLFISCLTPYERNISRQEKAKNKIDKLFKSFPDLLKADTLTLVKSDTIINERDIIIRDSIVVPKEVIDSSINFKYDSLYKVHQANLDILFTISKDNKAHFIVTKKEQVIYKLDTIKVTDTIIKTNTITEYKTIVNTEKSFLWSAWLLIRPWLWLILLLLIVITTIYSLKRTGIIK